MNTPICDFVREYAEGDTVRMHMPGHKGKGGFERLDITEIHGADSLFEASGIICESEKNASGIFGAETFYSTEGSSLCIRAMVQLLSMHARAQGKKPLILAARNVHKSFVSALALTGCDADWLYGDGSYLCCRITGDDIRDHVKRGGRIPTAVYVTSPDYLGCMCDISDIAAACHEHGILLAVDNAHGAYLKFLTPSRHPIDLGADICCDSAHKTLPALTGAAYLHISKTAPKALSKWAKSAMSLFASTSPSYLILQSLDQLNLTLYDGFSAKLTTFICKIEQIKQKIESLGYVTCGDEPMKITIKAKRYGYLGHELSGELAKRGIEAEFADSDYLVLMPSPSSEDADMQRLLRALDGIERREPIDLCPPSQGTAVRVMTVRDAVLAPCEEIGVCDSVGRVLAAVSVGCPPAVPIAISGEIIDSDTLKLFTYYGIKTVSVVSCASV